MGRSQVRRRTTVKRKQYGGAELPLITYTPNYREMEVTNRSIVPQYIDRGAGNAVFNGAILRCTIKLPDMPIDPRGHVMNSLGETSHVGDRLKEIPIDIQIRKLKLSNDEYVKKEYEEIKEKFGIVFLAYIQTYQRTGTTHYNYELTFMDTFGNIYSGHSYQGKFGAFSPPSGLSYPLNRYVYSPMNWKKLPDSMIDHLIDNLSRRLYYQHAEGGTEHRGVRIAQFFKPPNPNAIPHRSFQPTADLADYLAALEARAAHDKPTTVNSDTQTNAALNEKITPAKAIENVRRHMENEFTKLRQRFNNVDDMLFLVGSMGSQAIHPNYVKRVNANSRNKSLWVNSNTESNSNNEGQGKNKNKNKNKNKTKKNVGV